MFIRFLYIIITITINNVCLHSHGEILYRFMCTLPLRANKINVHRQHCFLVGNADYVEVLRFLNKHTKIVPTVHLYFGWKQRKLQVEKFQTLLRLSFMRVTGILAVKGNDYDNERCFSRGKRFRTMSGSAGAVEVERILHKGHVTSRAVICQPLFS